MKKALSLLAGLLAVGSGQLRAADLIVNPTGRLIVHSNIAVNAGSFIVQSGGTVEMDLGAVISATNVVYAGTLTVSSNNMALASGSTFKVFNSPTYSGAFLSVNVPSLSAGLVWKNTLTANGTLAVATATPPHFSALQSTPAGMVLSGTGGTPNGGYAVLTTANLSLPAAQWAVLTTNTFDASGAFTFTCPPGILPQQFFVIELR